MINFRKHLLTAGLTLLALPGFALRTDACTGFQFRAGENCYLAKNHDFMIGDGLLCVNRRGIGKRSVQVPQPAEWVSRYGSVTYNQYGRELPNGGMNEAGLVVEMLWLDEAKYAPTDGRKELNTLQWIQYQLDTAGTVAEVIASDREVRVADRQAQVHYFVSDRSGGVAILELLDGQLRVYTGKDLPVAALANNRYAESVEAFRSGMAGQFDAKASASPVQPSFGRFSAVAAQTGKYAASGKTPEAFALDALQKVRHPKFTQWQVVYDTAKPRIFLRRIVDETVREVDFATCDFAPQARAMAADLTTPGPLVWVECTTEVNRALVRESYRKTPFLQQIPAEAREQIAAFPDWFVPVDQSALTTKNAKHTK